MSRISRTSTVREIWEPRRGELAALCENHTIKQIAKIIKISDTHTAYVLRLLRLTAKRDNKLGLPVLGADRDVRKESKDTRNFLHARGLCFQ